METPFSGEKFLFGFVIPKFLIIWKLINDFIIVRVKLPAFVVWPGSVKKRGSKRETQTAFRFQKPWDMISQVILKSPSVHCPPR